MQSQTSVEEGSARVQFFAAIVATISFSIGGTIPGWSSIAIPYLQGEDSHIPVSPNEGSWLASVTMLAALVFMVPVGYIIDIWGRKPIFVISALPVIASWLMLYFATTVGELFAARIVCGFSFGVAYTTCPIYVGEIAEDRIRGTLGTIFQFMINFGMLFEYSIGPYVSYKTLCLASTVFPIVMFVTALWLPESPYFLMSKNRRTDAEKVLMNLRGKKIPESVKDELDMIQLSVEKQSKKKGSFRDLIGSRGNLKALMIVIVLILIQQFSGIIAMLSYMTEIFRRSGSSLDADVSVIIFGCVQLLISVASSGIADKAGRRLLLLVSSIGCTITLGLEGLYFYLVDKDIDTSISIDWMPLTFLTLYIIVYMVGLGPLPWAVAGEIFPSNVKGVAVAIGAMVSGGSATLVTKLFQLVGDAHGIHVVFWMFSGCCVAGAVFIAVFLPETKGKSLLQINEEINAGTQAQSVESNKENTGRA